MAVEGIVSGLLSVIDMYHLILFSLIFCTRLTVVLVHIFYCVISQKEKKEKKKKSDPQFQSIS